MKTNRKTKSEVENGTRAIAAQVPVELADRLARKAQESDRSVASELRRAVRFYLESDRDAA